MERRDDVDLKCSFVSMVLLICDSLLHSEEEKAERERSHDGMSVKNKWGWGLRCGWDEYVFALTF